MNPAGTVEGRTILITGAVGSLGSVAAKACAAAGARIVLSDKLVPKLEQLHDEIAAAGHPQPAIFPLDLSGASESDYRELAEIVERELGALHGLLHSAAELGTPGLLYDLAASDWQRLLHVNLTAAHLLTQALVPLMHRSGNATIVFTSDSSANQHHAYWGAYGIAKAALESYAHMLTEELESGGNIGVHLFVPGPVRSSIRKKSHPGELPSELPAPETLGSRYIELFAPARTAMQSRSTTSNFTSS
jgi:NAD(P)-dependent dehydrogenase (short-subunit alcohol dehydrogenase family)